MGIADRGEGRHQLARVIFHGKRGELHQRYRKGQEDQLGALGLVVNLVVLWNTIYMDAAVKQLSAEGYEVQPEDIARLSPLGTSTCSADTPSRCPTRSPEVNLGRYVIPRQPGSTRREQACVGFLFRCYSNPYMAQ